MTVVEQLYDKVAEANKKPTKKSNTVRTRKFCITTYIPQYVLTTLFENSKWIQHWAVATHDKDLNEDGTPKVAHTHCLLYTYEAKTSSSIHKKFVAWANELANLTGGEPQNSMVQEMHDSASQFRYLTHKDDKQKYQYNNSIIECDDLAYWNTLNSTEGMNDTKNVGFTILTDLMNGVPLNEMCLRYGKEFIYHYSHYCNMCASIATEAHRPNFQTLRDLCEFAFAQEDCTYTDIEIQAFLKMLDYVNSQFNFEASAEYIQRSLRA